jgi:hypothetical protein
VCHDVAHIYDNETPTAKAFCAKFSSPALCVVHCVDFCKGSADPKCADVLARHGLPGVGQFDEDSYGDDDLPLGQGGFADRFGSLDGGLPFAAPAPPTRSRPTGVGVGLPLMLVLFFGCFFYQTYKKHQNGRRRGDEQEGVSLMDCVRPAARAMSNRTSDMLDRRRDARHGGLAQNDGGGRWHGRDEDEDGML